MTPQDVIRKLSLCAVLCCASVNPCTAKEKQASGDPQLAQLYIKLLGTSS